MADSLKGSNPKDRRCHHVTAKSYINALLLLATTIAPLSTNVSKTEAAELSAKPESTQGALPCQQQQQQQQKQQPTTTTTQFTSPDKSETVYVTSDNSFANIYLKGRGKEQDLRLMQVRADKFSKLQWLSDNKTILYLARPFPNDWVHLISTDVKTTLSRDLTPFANKSASAFELNKSKDKAFVRLTLDETKPDSIYQIDITSGALTAATTPSNTLLVEAIDLPIAKPVNKQYRSEIEKTIEPVSGQELLAKKYQGRIEQFFQFCDPPANTKASSDYILMPWAEQEKEKIRSAIGELAIRAPGLVLRAAHGQRIKLWRQNKSSCNCFMEVIEGKTESPAFTNDREITFTDTFFKEYRIPVVFALAHELTHAADYRQKLSMSPEWIKLSAAKVNFVHQVQKRNKQAGLPLLDNLAAGYYDLPSDYSACSMEEALADSVGYYLCKDYRPSPATLSFINKYLLSEPSGSPDYAIELEQAREYIHKGAIAQGLAKYNQIIKSDANFLEARLERADTYVLQGRLKEAYAEAQTCLTKCNTLGAPKFEKTHCWSYMERAYALYFMGRRKESLVDLKRAADYAYDKTLVKERLDEWQEAYRYARRNKLNIPSRAAKASAEIETLCKKSIAQDQKLEKVEKDEKEPSTCIVYNNSNNTSTIWRVTNGKASKPTGRVMSFPCYIERLERLNDKETVVCLAKQFPRSPVHLFSINLMTTLTRDLTPFAKRDVRAFYYDHFKMDLVAQINLRDTANYELHRIDPGSGAVTKEQGERKVLPLQTIYAAQITDQKAFKKARPPKSIAAIINNQSYQQYGQPLTGQQELAEKYDGRLEQFFYFYQPRQGETASNGVTLKQWKAADRSKTEECIRTIAHRLPGLILNAYHGRRIKLMRVSKLPRSENAAKSNTITTDSAMDQNSAILLADNFFDLWPVSRSWIFTESLTHVADLEGNLSLSKNWVKAVGINVSLLRQAAQYRSSDKQQKQLQQPQQLQEQQQLQEAELALARCFKLPSINSRKGLSEALADSMRAYAYCSYKPTDTASAFIQQHLLAEPTACRDNGQNLQTAIDLIETKDYTRAIALLSPIVDSDLQYPLACYHRARAYRLSGQYKLAMADIARSLTILRERGVPEFDTYYQRTALEKSKLMQALSKR